MNRDDAIRKIRACLARARSANEAKAASAMRQAQALMREHQLGRGINRPAHRWTAGELDILREYYPRVPTSAIAEALGLRVPQVHAKANAMRLHKLPEVVAEIARQRMSDPNHGGRKAWLQKGRVPANKGVKRPPGWSPGNMAATQFKKGNSPHTTLPIGSLVVDPDGYLCRKVAEMSGPKSMRWKPVHRLVWEAANGPVPAGHLVVFKPGRRSTVEAEITPDAVELLTLAENMARNTIHNHPPELVSVMRLRGVLNRKINQRSKRDEQREDDQ